MIRTLSLSILLAIAAQPALAQQDCCDLQTNTNSTDCCGASCTEPTPTVTSKPSVSSKDVFPIDRKEIGAAALTAKHHGFEIPVCGSSCAGGFAKLSEQKKDSYIAAKVQPANTKCALSGCPSIAPLARQITHKGVLLTVCCPNCQAQWAKTDDAGRDKVLARVMQTSKGKTLPVSSLPAVNCGSQCCEASTCIDSCPPSAAQAECCLPCCSGCCVPPAAKTKKNS